MKYRVVGIGPNGERLDGTPDAKSKESAIAKVKAQYNQVNSFIGKKIDLETYKWSAEI